MVLVQCRMPYVMFVLFEMSPIIIFIPYSYYLSESLETVIPRTMLWIILLLKTAAVHQQQGGPQPQVCLMSIHILICCSESCLVTSYHLVQICSDNIDAVWCWSCFVVMCKDLHHLRTTSSLFLVISLSWIWGHTDGSLKGLQNWQAENILPLVCF